MILRVLSCAASLLGLILTYAGRGNPIALDTGPQLFVDEYLISNQSQLQRVLVPPQRLPQPVIDGPNDQNFQPFVSVVQDPQTHRFRGWYGVPRKEGENYPSHLAYMESEDGIHWIRPHRVLVDPGGFEVRFGASVFDDGTDVEKPTERFKFGWYSGPVSDPPTGGLMVAVSADGLTWKTIVDRVVLPHNHDINNIFHDQLRGCYVATVSITAPDSALGKTLRMPYQSQSTDLIHWSVPKQVLFHDKLDDGELQFYAMSAYLIRGPLIIGMAKVLRDEISADPKGPHGTGYSVLTWTRDGMHWERDREPFLDRNRTLGTWDHAMSWADCQLLVGDKCYIYYGGYKNGHKANRFTERQIGLAVMPRDRYVARRAQSAAATLLTTAFTSDASSLTVNANISGDMRIAIEDESGKAYSGFDLADCEPIRGDSVTLAVRWKGKLSTLRHQVMRFRFVFSKGDLFSFDLEK